MHPSGVSVTLDECEELAKDEDYIDKWDTAASYASKMLPAIFRPDDSLMQISFAPNDRIKLEEIIDGIDDYIFSAEDALGWVYQFWQSEAKEVINKSGEKIDGEKLPAVTQLFTEPYMVHFLIDNTIGAWWVGRNPGIKPPVNFKYLRYLEDGTPAAGGFDGWPDTTAEVSALDPCMGSGHFIVSMFTVFANLRMHEEGLSKEEATDRVIVENLHGLEIDPRCTQIAAFNLALTAWRFCENYKELPEMNLACSGIAPQGKIDDWLKLVGKVNDPVQKARLENGMYELHEHFKLAPELGSLIDPSTIEPGAFTASYEELLPVLQIALQEETNNDIVERGVMAAGIAKVGNILLNKYYWIITNVPFLGRGRFSDFFMKYSGTYYPKSKYELGTIFIERCLKLLHNNGFLSFVSPQNWMFPKNYIHYRKHLLNNYKWSFIMRLGTRAFMTISGEVVNVGLYGLINSKPEKANTFFAVDVSRKRNPAAKELALLTDCFVKVTQLSQLNNIESRISLTDNPLQTPLERCAKAHEGSSTGDQDRFLFNHWEIILPDENYDYFQFATESNNYYSGNTGLIKWEKGNGYLAQFRSARIQGLSAFNKYGILVGRVGHLKICHYSKSFFDKSCVAIIPKRSDDLTALFCYTTNKDFSSVVKSLDPRLSIATSVFEKIPFDLEYWKEVAAREYPNGLPRPYSDNITQWLFHGHPIKAENPLQVAVARLLDYTWPVEKDTDIELSYEAQALIRNIRSYNILSDEDGIVCIPTVNAEESGAERLRNYLKTIYGDDWKNHTINQLLTQENAKSSNLENWLRKEFFIQHCKLFNNRPFIWHIWDGRNDGFSALVNYHKLNKETLSKLIYTYLGDWIRVCESRKKNGESGAEGLLSAAHKLKEKLELILEGEVPYDIFVRWKSLEQQPIGWDPDLNDGVRLNIRPFIEADVLRKKPNIKWGVDRGKNPPGSPWGEVRDNSRHLTLAEKTTARKEVKE